MESEKIYEESYSELKRIRKEMSSSKVTINFDKLDEQTKADLNAAISASLSRRIRATEQVVLSK